MKTLLLTLFVAFNINIAADSSFSTGSSPEPRAVSMTDGDYEGCQEGAILRVDEYIRGRDFRVTYECVNGVYTFVRKTPTGSSND